MRSVFFFCRDARLGFRVMSKRSIRSMWSVFLSTVWGGNTHLQDETVEAFDSVDAFVADESAGKAVSLQRLGRKITPSVA